MKKRIWVVTELFYPEETAVAYIFTRIADYLSRNYDVCVLSGPEFYDKNKEFYRDSFQLNSNIKIYRTKTFNFDKNSLIQRTLKIVLLSIQMAFMVIRRVRKGDTVLLATNPAPLLLIISKLKRWKKLNLHILVHDVFPENTIPAQVFKSNRSVGYRLLKFVFDKAYSSADHLIAIGRDMKVVLEQKTNRFKRKPAISIVTNWSKPIKVKSANKISSNDEISSNKIVLQYAGNIGRVQALDILVEAFTESNNPDIHLIIRGTGALSKVLENIIQSKQCKNITLLGGYSRNDEYEILSKCDISIVSLANGMYGLGVPSKTYNLLSAAKPILFIGEPNTEIALMVNENDIGWTIDISNKERLVEFFNNLNKDKIGDYKNKGEKACSLSGNQFEETKVLALFQNKMELYL